jgi:arsenate reductase
VRAELREEPDGKRVLEAPGRGRFEAYSAGIDPTEEIHPCAIEAMREVGIDITDRQPKGLKQYMGNQTFNYLVIVCARAEERCPNTFPGVDTTFLWIFEDPRRDEDLPYDSMLERFRAVREEIELRMRTDRGAGRGAGPRAHREVRRGRPAGAGEGLLGLRARHRGGPAAGDAGPRPERGATA